MIVLTNTAKRFTQDMLLSKEVDLIPVDLDKYNRIVAWVSIGGVNFNKLLIEKGLAYHYTKYSDNAELEEAEKKARRNLVGLWQISGEKPQHLSKPKITKSVKALSQSGGRIPRQSQKPKIPQVKLQTLQLQKLYRRFSFQG